MTEAVTYEVIDAVAWMTINRPEAHNALNKAVRDGLFRGFERFNRDAEAAVLVLTGAGDRAFSAGGDLKEMAETGLKVPPPDFVPQLNRNVIVDKPVVAAVNGIAYGGGFLLAQMCDLCVAADHARFAITEAKWGRGAPWAAPLPWMIPPRLAMELLLTAEPFEARRAYDIGLVNRVVAPGELREAAQTLATTIARNAPLSLSAGKAMVYEAVGLSWREMLKVGEQRFAPVYLSEDAQEGPRAFREGRAPAWQAR